MPYTPEDFIRLNDGEFMDFDNSYGAQCVDLFNYYKQQVIGGDWMPTPDTGGAADLWNDFDKDGSVATDWFTRIPNTETSVPEYGDVIIWAANVPGITGPAGHVGIFVSGDVNTMHVFNQNWPNNSPCHTQWFANYAGVLGYLRPKTWLVPRPKLNIPTPVPETPVVLVPSPEPETVPEQPAPPAPADDVVIVPIPDPVEPSPELELQPELPSEPEEFPTNFSTPPLTPPVVEPHNTTMGNTLREKLKSRKFWLAVAAIITFVANNQYDQALFVVLGYTGFQAWVDTKN